MEFITKFLNEGVEGLDNSSFKQKIELSNRVALAASIMALPYLVLYLFFYPPLSVYFGISIALILSVPYFNSQSLFTISRLIIVLVPNLIVYLSSIIITPEGKAISTGLSMNMLALGMLPFLFFELSEYLILIFLVIFLSSLSIFSEFFSGIIEEDNSRFEFLLSSNMEFLYKVTALVISMILMYLFKLGTDKSEKQNKMLLEEMQNKGIEQERDREKLNSYIQEIQKAQDEEKRRTWASDGLAQFSEVLRLQHDDIKQLGDRIISRLIKYIGANQGGLFIIEEENNIKYLNLISAYAYERKKFISKRVEIGEGLVGQCYLEKDTIFMTKLPKNYTYITSGIGESTPSCLLIVPLIVNEIVYGVVEIASFKIIEDYKIDFIKKLGETIASTLANAKINEKTKILLNEAQMSQEQMRAQEEEMRQNMEELQATQEELARKSAEVEEVRVLEKQRFENQLDSQKKLMEQFMIKTKAREAELLDKIKLLESNNS